MSLSSQSFYCIEINLSQLFANGKISRTYVFFLSSDTVYTCGEYGDLK